MLYPSDFEEKIGFSTVRTMLKDACDSLIGKSYVDDMQFITSRSEIITLLNQTNELVKAISSGLTLPSSNFPDIFSAIAAAKTENSFIAADKFLDIKKYLVSIQEIRDFFVKSDDGAASFPYLSKKFVALTVFPDIISEIERVINKFGEVKDNASPELYDITRQISSVSSSMSTLMRRILSKAVEEGIVEKDAAPAMRDGRLVIPVLSTNKRRINGIVHDVSATGKTSYIEPAEIVVSGNRLRELEMDRLREIAAILTNLTDFIRPRIDEIEDAARLAGFYDFTRAKAKVAISMNARMPVIERQMEFDWFHAVHPVLQMSLSEQGKEVVPMNLRLERPKTGLIISGPNAGGKSVCLKTVGIVQYMMQCGLLPTLYANSHMGVLSKIFIDIGDQQSIENDLSTYSSHLRAMKFFLTHTDKSTLILIDEIGSGTEPQIGGALAQAILSDLIKSQCFCIATTHYQNLKTFADDNEHFLNGSMLYDRQKLRPLFQLSIGHPGSSFALEIARSIGLPADVIEQAKDIVGSDYVNTDKYILDIARDRNYWANKRQSIKEKEARISKLAEMYEAKAEELNANARKILRDARMEASEIVRSANSQIERTIHEIKVAQAEKERTRSVRAELEAYKREIENAPQDKKIVPETLGKKKKKQNTRRNPETISPDELKEGDYVKIDDGGAVGKIISISKDKAEVAFGALRTIVSVKKLKATKPPKTDISTQMQSVGRTTAEESRKRQLSFHPDLDVRGMRADEALQAVTYFLDDATQFESSRVRILHGTGTGALRSVIRQFLKTYPSVTSFGDEDVRLGGIGITVVNLS